MAKKNVSRLLVGLVALAATTSIIATADSVLATAPTATAVLEIVPLGTYSGSGGLQASEIVAFDPTTKRMFINNGALNRIDIVDITTPSAPSLFTSVDMTGYGRGAQSVAVGNGIVAVAVDVAPTITSGTLATTANNGVVVLMDTAGVVLKTLSVGNLPDHVSFTPDKKTILVAGEGEPICAGNDPNTVIDESKLSASASDANGTVALIDVSTGASTATVTTLDFSSFNKTDLLAEDVRVFFPGSSAAQDLEPEYITTNAAGTRAYVTLQEANAMAIVNLNTKTILDVVSLGYKDWSAAGLLYDGSKVDGAGATASANPISYSGFPLKGMYMPDTIASYTSAGQTYVVMANEGDTREYGCYNEESTFDDVSGSDSFSSYWDAANNDVKPKAKLGAQKTTLAFPTKTFVSGTRSNMYTLGGRSFTIRDSSGTVVWDSGSEFEEIVLRDYPAAFNSDSSSSAATSGLMVAGQPSRMDGRSTSKGVEPEALAVGTIGTQTFAFIGLERMGGIMIYDVTSPASPSFIRYTNVALAGLAAGDNTTPGSFDVSPEGMLFVPAAESPTTKPLLIVASELSGTTTIYEIRVATPTTVPTSAPTTGTVAALAEKTLLTSTGTPEAGSSISVTSNGFVPYETVQLVISTPPTVVATVTADAYGSVTTTGQLSSGIMTGKHTFALFAPVSGIGYRSALTVRSSGDILGIVGSDTTYFVMNALTDGHNLSARYNPNGDKAVNIPPLVSANANVEAGEATLASVSWLKKGRLAWPGGAVLPADANCTTQYVFGGVGSTDTAQDGDVSGTSGADIDVPFTPATSVPGGPSGGTYDVRLGVQPPNGSGDGQKAIKGVAVKGVTYASGCLDIGRSSSTPSSSNTCGTPTNCESWAFALDAIGWTYFPGNTQPAVSSGIIGTDMNKIYQCATENLDVNGDGDYFDTGDMKSGYPKIQYWNQLTADSNVSVEPTKIAPYRIQPGSGTGNDVATIFFGRGTSGQNTDSVVLADCDGYPSASVNDKDGNIATSFTFPIVQEHDCRNVADADKARAICFYGYSRWVLQARSLETEKRNGAVFGKFGPNSSELKRPSFSTINTTDSRYKGSRYVYNVLPLYPGNGLLAGSDYGRTPDARRFVGVSLQPEACATNAVASVVSEVTANADCNFDGDLTDTGVAVGAVPGFICGDATARRIIATFGFKPIASGATSLTDAAYGTSYCRYNQAAL